MWVVVRRVPRHWIRPPPPPVHHTILQETIPYSIDDEFGPDAYAVPKRPIENRNIRVKKFVFHDFDDFGYV